MKEKNKRNIDKDIEILKEKLKILNDTKLKKTDQLERELQAIENVLAELEKKDKKLKDIEKHIEAEIMMIEKTYNEVGLFAQKQYEGMRASYKCLLNVFLQEKR